MIDGGNSIRMKQLPTNVQKFLYIAASQLCSEVNSVYILKIAVLALAIILVAPALAEDGDAAGSVGLADPSCVYCSALGYECKDGECGPSNCSRWTMKDDCNLAVEHSGLISKLARINNSEGQSAEDVLGWDVTYMGEDGKCYSRYVAQAPLEGMTEPVEADSPPVVRAFDSYMVDYEGAIAIMKSMRCGGTFVELSLYWPSTPEAEEPEWHIKTEIGNEIIIGANSGKSRC